MAHADWQIYNTPVGIVQTYTTFLQYIDSHNYAYYLCHCVPCHEVHESQSPLCIPYISSFIMTHPVLSNITLKIDQVVMIV